MSNFLKLIQEATPESGTAENIGKGQLAADANKSVKKGSIIGKAASFAQKTAALASKIGDIGQGKWDIGDALQKILNKQLDKSTNKMGYFGKSGFNKIKLGDDIIKKINIYGQDASDTSEEAPEASEANEAVLPAHFLKKINEAQASLDRNEKGGFKNMEQMAGNKGGKSKAVRVWDILKDVLKLDTEMKLTDPGTGKKVVDRRVQWISKGVPSFLKAVKETYPDIPFTFKGHDPKKGLSGASVEDAEEPEFNFQKSYKDDWIKSLGEDKAKKIVQGLKDIYPGDRIEFEEPAEDPEPAEEPVVTPDSKLTIDNALFELTGRTSFGEKGIQYTLKPLTPDVANILKDRDIKYLTYLLQSKDNEFKTAEGNSGIVYAYDNENQLINPITTERVNFEWNGQEKLYILSTENEQLMGVKYSDGQYPINKSDVKVLTDGKHIIMRPDEKSVYMKFLILQDLPSTKQYLINYTKGTTATEAEIAEADAKANPSPTSEVKK